MAKSLRSKKMRQNRRALRKTVSEPIVQQRLVKLSEAQAKEIKEKSGGALSNLKSVLSKNSKAAAATTVAITNYDNNNEGVVPGIGENNGALINNHRNTLIPGKKKGGGGKKARENSGGKVLEWF